MDGFDICTVQCCGCEMQTGTSRNLIVRASWEFERYANVEILELIYVHIVICQTEEGLMRIMNSYRLTIFLDAETEVAGFETEPNEESMGPAQARGSILYGCVKESSCRQRLRWMRAYQESMTCAHLFHGVNLLKAGRWTQGTRRAW